MEPESPAQKTPRHTSEKNAGTRKAYLKINVTTGGCRAALMQQQLFARFARACLRTPPSMLR
jgi:hypothetical protein